MRLDKVIADKLNISRKESNILIKKKEITINDSIITNPSFNIKDTDIIKYQGNILKTSFTYLLMNKPKNYVCALKDNLHKTIMELVPKNYLSKDLRIVGRLDIDTVGLILLSNDGAFIHELTSPKKNIYKKYYCEYDAPLPSNAIELLKEGILIDDYIAKDAILEVIDEHTAYLSIKEGKFHQVKKMFNYFGSNITYLKRVQIGSLLLGDLEEGQVRELEKLDLDKLKE